MNLSPDLTYAFLLILIRTSGMLVSAPLLSHKGIPAQTKVGFAVFFALVLVPITSDHAPVAPSQMGSVIDGVMREVLFGLALGLSMNLVFLGTQMASRIIELLHNPERARQMGQLGREVVEKKFSCDSQLDSVERLYGRLLSGNRLNETDSLETMCK